MPDPAGKIPLQARLSWCILLSLRRGDREADGARLESGCSASYRGFESPPLRHLLILNGPVVVLPDKKIAGRSDSRVPRNDRSRTPSGPEGSSGSDFRRVPRGCLAVTCVGNFVLC